MEKRRRRTVMGAIALLALVFSFAENAWASTCAEEVMRSAAGSHSAAMPHDGSQPMHGGGHGSPADERAPASPGCPMAPLAGVHVCAAMVSVPTTYRFEIANAPHRVAAAVTPDAVPPLLLGTAVFHPPRA